MKRFWKDESGATAIEYTIVAAGIAMAIVTTLGIAGSNISTLYTTIAAAV